MQSDENCLQLKVPDHTDEKMFLVEVKSNVIIKHLVTMQQLTQCREHHTDDCEGTAD